MGELNEIRGRDKDSQVMKVLKVTMILIVIARMSITSRWEEEEPTAKNGVNRVRKNVLERGGKSMRKRKRIRSRK